MPELKRLDGIVIYLMFNDIKHYNQPHVHVFYGEFKASVAIDGTLLAGELPAKQLKTVHWDNGQIDCSPDYMFEHSFEYNTSEIVVA